MRCFLFLRRKGRQLSGEDETKSHRRSALMSERRWRQRGLAERRRTEVGVVDAFGSDDDVDVVVGRDLRFRSNVGVGVDRKDYILPLLVEVENRCCGE